MGSSLRSLYICYYPLTEPLVRSQVVAYLSGLAGCGHTVHLLTFETEAHTVTRRRELHREMRDLGIAWHSLRYHKRPTLPATVFDVFCGALKALQIMRRHRLEAVHARSHVPAAMGLLVKRLTGCRLIFDIRGLLAEEYVDAGNWQEGGLPFRVTKTMERRSLAAADGIVVLTERVHRELFSGPETQGKALRVIPCCADLSQIEAQSALREEMRARLGLDGHTVMVYAGKFGGWYMQDEMAEFFAQARQMVPGLHFLVLTQSEREMIVAEFAKRGIPDESFTVTRVEPAQVGAYLAAADFSLSFIRPCRSKIASSPTKIGEYLAAGLPVLCNSGIGDVDEVITGNCVGALIENFAAPDYEAGLNAILPLLNDENTRAVCQKAAREHASLSQVGIPRYDSLYRELAQNKSKADRKVAAN